MKVLLVNGSPRPAGCTYTALSEIAAELEQCGVQAEIFQAGAAPIGGCIGCGGCAGKGACVFGGPVNELIEKAFAAYDDYEFHVISHAVNDFCVVELSSFYLDIIKDRLYCEEKNGLERRSAQTALFLILDTMTKLFAPILAFTCDEIWLAMPHREGDDVRNVVLNEMNKPFTQYALSAGQMAKWDRIIAIRDAVNVALEAARAEKKIGKALEAKVELTVAAEDAFLAEMDAAVVADLFIVSQVCVTVGTEMAVAVHAAEGEKCQRCWKFHTAVDANGLCPRCAGVIAKSTSFEAL